MLVGERRRGFTAIEILVLVVGMAGLSVMLLPWLQASRERSRVSRCMMNLTAIARAASRYSEAHDIALPPSSQVTRNADGRITAVDGWSWLVLLLPFREETGAGDNDAAMAMYVSLDVDDGRPLVEPPERLGTPHADALRTRLPSLLCPNFRGSPYADPLTKRLAITNYKAMGATHAESLSIASPNPSRPKYEGRLSRSRDTRRSEAGSVTDGTQGESTSVHPDGASFPGAAMAAADLPRGTSRTILASETVEQRHARWTVGADAATVALPPEVAFEWSADEFVVPQGHAAAIAGASGIYWTHRTYLNWECDRRPSDGGDGQTACMHGPSSHHPGIVTHLFADGHIEILNKDIDTTLYMYLVMRHGGFVRATPPGND